MPYSYLFFAPAYHTAIHLGPAGLLCQSPSCQNHHEKITPNILKASVFFFSLKILRGIFSRKDVFFSCTLYSICARALREKMRRRKPVMPSSSFFPPYIFFCFLFAYMARCLDRAKLYVEYSSSLSLKRYTSYLLSSWGVCTSQCILVSHRWPKEELRRLRMEWLLCDQAHAFKSSYFPFPSVSVLGEILLLLLLTL